jgi:hypothetical protein
MIVIRILTIMGLAYIIISNFGSGLEPKSTVERVPFSQGPTSAPNLEAPNYPPPSN